MSIRCRLQTGVLPSRPLRTTSREAASCAQEDRARTREPCPLTPGGGENHRSVEGPAAHRESFTSWLESMPLLEIPFSPELQKCFTITFSSWKASLTDATASTRRQARFCAKRSEWKTGYSFTWNARLKADISVRRQQTALSEASRCLAVPRRCC